MNKEILNTGVQYFINENYNTDIMSVLLKKPVFAGVSQKELAEQLEAKKKCQHKLPLWFETPQIYYPKKLNIEQTSSEETARYKTTITEGKSLVDLTGGFGVDSYFFGQKFNTVFHCELNSCLSEIVAHNFKILDAKNIEIISNDGLNFLQEENHHFDWVYVDPSRRNDLKGKVFRLSDCSPNVVDHLKLLFRKTENVLLKTSPLLDISAGIAELRFVKEIHVVAVNNEVKELLWVLKKDFSQTITIKTINLKNSKNEIFNFKWGNEKKTVSNYSQPLVYLYEPNVSILKSGAFKLTGNAFSLFKLHEHTHLYTSNELVSFPGRRFKILASVPYNKKKLRAMKIEKANITLRNFPESVKSIRTKFKIKDGGETYLFFTTDHEGKYVVLECAKA